MSLGLEAFSWGIASAVSLPAGAMLGLWWRPQARINSAFMAFGAGALLFALTIELFAHIPHYVESHGYKAIFVAVGGAISGGLLFTLLNKLLNTRGAFMRNLSNARNYVSRLKMQRKKELVKELSRVKILSGLEPEQMVSLVQHVVQARFDTGEVIFRQGDEADEMFFIIEGEVAIIFHEEGQPDKILATLGTNDTFGELGILSHFPRSADAVALHNVRTYKILQRDVDDILSLSPSLQTELKELSISRIDDLDTKSDHHRNDEWKARCLKNLGEISFAISKEEIRAEGKTVSHNNAAFAIWLGILIDGIPESLIIGMLAVSVKGVSLAFIAGVFLANLPEAMSSAVSMRNNGLSLKRIYLMWGSICLLTGVGAFIGSALFSAEPTGAMFYLVLGIEGLAAGAMLTMIAETMLPEAFELGGSVVGLSTLGGFLTTLVVKVM